MQNLVDLMDRGSSPRMWGAHDAVVASLNLLRIIPADAGSTALLEAPRLGVEDHPRGCGEHGMGLSVANEMDGSSPRMRGALPAYAHMRGEPRIIPADAGSTGSSPSPPPASGDHPRGCGEHAASKSDQLMIWGSSPRMRGAHYTI